MEKNKIENLILYQMTILQNMSQNSKFKIIFLISILNTRKNKQNFNKN